MWGEKEFSIMDKETGVIKKDFFDFLTRCEVSRSMRYQNFATLMFLEPDLGFSNGLDLKVFASILKEELRTTDIIGRVNHIRFGIILPYADLESSQIVGERVRSRIENYLFPMKKKSTVSLGGACLPTNVTNCKDLISMAEHKLQTAKQNGGNILCLP